MSDTQGNTSTPERIFLGWERPAIELVAERLLMVNRLNPQMFRHATVVVPTAESGRRLRERLAEIAPNGALLMPRIILPGQILGVQEREADALSSTAAWVDVLSSVDPHDTWPDVFPSPIEETGREEWTLATAAALQQTQKTLCEEEKTLVDVVRALRSAEMEGHLGGAAGQELARWGQMRDLISAEDARVRRMGLIPPAEAQAAAAERAEWPLGCHLFVLACVPRLSPILCHFLSRLCCKQNGVVEIWIHAPEGLQHTFDAFGRPGAYWESSIIDIPDDRLHLCVNEKDVAGETCRLLAGVSSGEAVLGACDEKLTPYLQAGFSRQGWPLYTPNGRSGGSTDLADLPVLLKEALDKPLEAAPLERLLRNNALMAALCPANPERCAKALDELMMRHFPDRAESLRDFAAEGGPFPLLAPYVRNVTVLLQKMAEKAAFPRALWRLAAALERRLAGDSPYGKFAAKAVEAMQRMADLLSGGGSDLGYGTALLLLQSAIAELSLTVNTHENAVLDALGWLELPYAQGRRLVLAGMHDGCVPEAERPDPFLPDSLRAALGMGCRSTRLRRDSYLLTSLLACRLGAVDVVIAKTNAQGDPQVPSPLLFRCPEQELAARVKHLFRELEEQKPPTPYERGDWYIGLAQADGSVPPEEEDIRLIAPAGSNRWADPEATFSPSTLKSFLSCPLRFWMRNALSLNPDDAYTENKAGLEAYEYGNLVHDALQNLVRRFPELTPDATERALEDAAKDCMDTAYRMAYGEKMPFTIRPQHLRMVEHVKEFSRMHLQDLRDGWCNIGLEQSVRWLMDGDIPFHMRLDRVDRHAETGAIRVIDYKTHTRSPQEVHLAKVSGEDALRRFSRYMPGLPLLAEGDKLMRWADLQLPLYAAYVRDAYGADTTVQTAYYNIPRKMDDKVRTVAYSPWDIPAQIQESALTWTREVVRLIRAGKCLIPGESLGIKAYGDFGNLAPDGDLRAALHLPAID